MFVNKWISPKDNTKTIHCNNHGLKKKQKCNELLLTTPNYCMLYVSHFIKPAFRLLIINIVHANYERLQATPYTNQLKYLVSMCIKHLSLMLCALLSI